MKKKVFLDERLCFRNTILEGQQKSLIGKNLSFLKILFVVFQDKMALEERN